jgi:DNA-binding response OmpR family regulator
VKVGKRILLVDDDESLRQFLAEQLELYEEFHSTQVESGTSALEMVRAEHFDLILLNVGLPDLDGREVCRLIRRAGITSPVIMVTASDSDADVILGFESGANDYVTKPFRLSVLVARIRAHLRQHEQSEDAGFAIGPYTFRPAAKVLFDNDNNQRVRLTEKETAILKYLYHAGEKVVAREVLLDDVWGYNAGITTHTLETHIYRLRQKIEPDPTKAVLLVTEPGGYRLRTSVPYRAPLPVARRQAAPRVREENMGPEK